MSREQVFEALQAVFDDVFQEQVVASAELSARLPLNRNLAFAFGLVRSKPLAMWVILQI